MADKRAGGVWAANGGGLGYGSAVAAPAAGRPSPAPPRLFSGQNCGLGPPCLWPEFAFFDAPHLFRLGAPTQRAPNGCAENWGRRNSSGRGKGVFPPWALPFAGAVVERCRWAAPLFRAL